jgi:NADP-dependent 3-hydroxy acid dehydrogenase YdfG
VAVAALDVNDHDQVPKVFAELEDQLGGIDRIIVNAGIGKGAPLGSGKLYANKQTIETTWSPPWSKSKPPSRCSRIPAADIWC